MLTHDPYLGELPFVCAICCPADRERVSALLGILQQNDCRLWYDQTVMTGEDPSAGTSVPLDEAAVTLAFLSEAAVEDHPFRQIFNRSILSGKPAAVVLLDPMPLTPVMALQLEKTQVIHYADCRTDGVCCLTILQLPQVKRCMEDRKTVHIPKSSIRKYYLKRRATGEEIHLDKDGFTVGRKLTCDYAIEDNDSISRVHAVFHLKNGVCTVEDNQSTNKVYVNDRELEEGECLQIKSGDELELGTEKFVVDVIE